MVKIVGEGFCRIRRMCQWASSTIPRKMHTYLNCHNPTVAALLFSISVGTRGRRGSHIAIGLRLNHLSDPESINGI